MGVVLAASVFREASATLYILSNMKKIIFNAVIFIFVLNLQAQAQYSIKGLSTAYYRYSDQLGRSKSDESLKQVLNELTQENVEVKKELVSILQGIEKLYPNQSPAVQKIIGEVLESAHNDLENSDPSVRWNAARTLYDLEGDRRGGSRVYGVKLFRERKDSKALLWAVSNSIHTIDVTMLTEPEFSALRDAFVSIGPGSVEELRKLLEEAKRDEWKEKIALIIKEFEDSGQVERTTTQFFLESRLRQVNKSFYWFIVNLFFYFISSRLLFSKFKIKIKFYLPLISNIVSALILAIFYVFSGVCFLGHTYFYYGLLIFFVTVFNISFCNFENLWKVCRVSIFSVIVGILGFYFCAVLVYAIGLSQIGH